MTQSRPYSRTIPAAKRSRLIRDQQRERELIERVRLANQEEASGAGPLARALARRNQRGAGRSCPHALAEQATCSGYVPADTSRTNENAIIVIERQQGNGYHVTRIQGSSNLGTAHTQRRSCAGARQVTTRQGPAFRLAHVSPSRADCVPAYSHKAGV